MLRELALGLILLQAQVCHMSIKNWGERVDSLKALRQAILTDPNQALLDYCDQASMIAVYFRTDGKWLPVCSFSPEYRHRGRRYWRLIVSFKYEILSLSTRTVTLEWKLLR